ncbi:TolC family protein [Seonamhaeicola algicola]|uniref:TolC family protein n=1 Tax=Seonamhaeicola algicola TaxID=1719036 RepID=A0A5C7AVJ6_9FLAO|nr:TolC family protein [Seonamhaeicola algicola]TXE12728.1 TolC family protein [Seonamhaeicola algicola]
MKNQLVLFFSFLCIHGVFAQENKHSFSLQEAINYALENNRTIKNAALDILAAEQQVWETTARGLPQINGAVDYSINIKTPFDINTLPEDDPFRFLFPKHNLTPSVTLNQLLFDGGYIVGLQSNKVFLEISKNAKDKTVNTIETNVVSAYNNALLTKESIVITKNNIKVLTENLNETQKIFENGLTEEEDVEQLQLTLSSLENNLRSLETLFDISKGYLKILLGINQNETITLTDTLDSLVLENIALNLISDTHPVSNNIDYKIALNDVESKRLEYKLEQSEQLPKLNAFITSNYLGYSNSFSNYFKPEQDWLFTTAGGVKLTVPIFTSFGGKARRERAKIQWDIAKNNLIDTENQLSIEFKNAKNDYQLAIDTYNNKQKNLALAEKIERKNTIKYKEGIASSFDLRQAQTQLYTSQQEYLQAIIDVINKKATLKNLLNIKQ